MERLIQAGSEYHFQTNIGDRARARFGIFMDTHPNAHLISTIAQIPAQVESKITETIGTTCSDREASCSDTPHTETPYTETKTTLTPAHLHGRDEVPKVRRCARCKKRLPKDAHGRTKFCSGSCRTAYCLQKRIVRSTQEETKGRR